MAQRVFFLNNLKPGVEPADYEEWIRTRDYPIARKQEAISTYVVTRVTGPLSDGEVSPYQYLEVIEITDIEAYRAGMDGDPEFDQLMQEWSQYVGESVAVYGEVIDG
jgi:hypothetical protein